MTHCASCKAELLAGDVYCASCGVEVETEADGVVVNSPDQSLIQREHDQTATPVSGDEAEPVSAPSVDDATNTPSNEVRDSVRVTQDVKPSEAVEMPPPAEAHDAEQGPSVASAEELQARLDEAIQQFTDGGISAEMLGNIERTLKPQIDEALAHEVADAGSEGIDENQPSSSEPAATDSASRPSTARFPDVQVTLPALASDDEIRSKVEQALRDSGEHEAATSYARYAPLASNAVEHARQWVNIEQAGRTQAAVSQPRRWPQEKQAGNTAGKGASPGTQAANTNPSGSTQTWNQDKRPWIIGGAAAAVVVAIVVAILATQGSDKQYTDRDYNLALGRFISNGPSGQAEICLDWNTSSADSWYGSLIAGGDSSSYAYAVLDVLDEYC